MEMTERGEIDTHGASGAREQAGVALVEVALTPAIPGRGCLTYAVPVELLERTVPGTRVRVPLGRASRTGLVVGRAAAPPPTAAVRPILECLDSEPFLDRQVLELCRWAAGYYLAPIAEVIGTVVPAHVPRPRRARPRPLNVESPESVPPFPEAGPTAAPSLTLTAEQERAAQAIVAEVSAQCFRTFLLFGVTGSGKTDVYLAAARAAVEQGRSVLILTPEIGLAHETAERARAALGPRVLLLHSALAPGERWATWARAGRGEAMVAVGPRSALFVPLANLGLIVADEEHDQAYKQDEGVRYHGRDLAVVRARLASCPVVLASATPSVESFHHATSGRYTLLELRDRPPGRQLPEVSLLDTRDAADSRAAAAGERTAAWCSSGLRDAIQAAATRREQTLLFLNRRGFAHFVQCLACGEPLRCTECSVTLTLHAARRALVCHHCGLTRPADQSCERCGAPVSRGRAPGTEQIESALGRLFPGLRVARMDRDSTGRRGAQAQLLRAWHDGEIDVLVGTQMVTKGIDNPRVTLVGVLDADISLNQPDFRAAERTFQIVSQVGGRAGRGDVPGLVVVQTLRPDHYSLRAAAAHDYAALFAAEIEYRRSLGYPPFRRLINVRVEARDALVAERLARDFAATVRSALDSASRDPELVGPAPAPIERLRGWYRWQALVRGTSSAAMRRAIEHGLRQIGGVRGSRQARIVVDVDPCSML
jgi:primosomal protein N' (replication factor Y)